MEFYLISFKEKNDLFHKTNGILMVNLTKEEAEKYTKILNSDERFNMLYSDPYEPVEFVMAKAQEDRFEYTINLSKDIMSMLEDYIKYENNYDKQAELIMNAAREINTDYRMSEEQQETIDKGIFDFKQYLDEHRMEPAHAM